MSYFAPVISWDMLLQREPELTQLQLELKAVKDEGGPSFCANKLWYIQFEPRLREIVGPQAKTNDLVLRSTQAQILARNILYKLLPDCRNCVCTPW